MIRTVFIDDDLANLVLFEEICRQNNFHYTGIHDTKLIESTLSQLLNIDIIVLDLEIPKLDGYEILKLLRSKPQFEAVPIVACTVYSNEIERARSSGFSSYIMKPIDIDQFPQQLLRIIQGETIWETNSR